MTELLLDEKRGIELSGEEEEILIEIMACSIYKASEMTPPCGRSRGRVSNPVLFYK